MTPPPPGILDTQILSWSRFPEWLIYPCQLKVLTFPKKELVGLQYFGSKAFRPLEQLYLELVHRTKKLIIREILRLPHKREPVVFHWNLGIEPIHLKATNVPFAQRNKQKKI